MIFPLVKSLSSLARGKLESKCVGPLYFLTTDSAPLSTAHNNFFFFTDKRVGTSRTVGSTAVQIGHSGLRDDQTRKPFYAKMKTLQSQFMASYVIK